MKYMLLITLLVSATSSYANNCEIPQAKNYSMEDSLAVYRWAQGLAFADYAKHTIYKFNVKQYMDDNPNKALFAIGFAGGYECTSGYDFGTPYMSLITVFAKKIAKDADGFSEYYIELAEKYDLLQYISLKE